MIPVYDKAPAPSSDDEVEVDSEEEVDDEDTIEASDTELKTYLLYVNRNIQEGKEQRLEFLNRSNHSLYHHAESMPQGNHINFIPRPHLFWHHRIHSSRTAY